VGLLDEKGEAIPGRTAAECEAIAGDQIDALVLWKDGGDVTARAGKPTRLRIEMDLASLYAFRFTVGNAGKERDH
jgi:hypothetical protein